MTKIEGHWLYFKAVNRGKPATKPVEFYEKKAGVDGSWDQLLWYKWDRVVQIQSGVLASTFNHEED